MARLLAVLAAFLAAWFVLVGSAMAQEDNPFGNPALQERPRPQKRLIGRDAEGTPVEAVPLNPNVRPILIDDTQPPAEAPKEQHRVFGVSRRGELLARPQEEAATADTNQSIRAALASPTKMEFTEMPLVYLHPRWASSAPGRHRPTARRARISLPRRWPARG